MSIFLPWIIFWAIPSAYSFVRTLFLLSEDGKVDNTDRAMLFLALVPLVSIVFAAALLLVEACFITGRWWEKRNERPDVIARKIERKIRKRRRGPIVTMVQYLHKKRKEKNNEKTVPEA